MYSDPFFNCSTTALENLGADFMHSYFISVAAFQTIVRSLSFDKFHSFWYLQCVQNITQRLLYNADDVPQNNSSIDKHLNKSHVRAMNVSFRRDAEYSTQITATRSGAQFGSVDVDVYHRGLPNRSVACLKHLG
eukprot:IDg7487t1